MTVLFADVVGFTTLSERRDPEQVKHLVDRCFQWLVADIVSFGGRVDKIIGDAILALFGAPVAHEDDAERAVRAALRMQETVTTRAAELDNAVRIRVGVNSGEVLVGAMQAGGNYTAMGDVVNTANRLQTAAEPGEVLVGVATMTATAKVIPYEVRGVVAAKGREAPVRAWVAKTPSTAPGERPNRSTGKLVGRDGEVALLSRAADTALTNGRASLQLLLGEAGMGKSRISTEVEEELKRGHEALILEGRCVPYGEANVWWPVADALRNAIDVEPGQPLEVVEPRIRRLVAATLDLDADDVEGNRTADGLLQVFGFAETREDLAAGGARDEIARSLVKFLDAATLRGEVVIRLADLHWADDVVLELIESALTTLARRPLSILTTARRSLLERWSPPIGRFDTTVVNLEALDAASTDALIDVLLGDGDERVLDDAARVELRDRSGGNPLFLVELLALLDDERSNAIDGEGAAVIEGMPDTLRGLIAARLDNLGAAERAVIDDAAVLGRRGMKMHLEQMARILRSETDISTQLDELIDRDLIVVNGEVWEFRSDLTREVAYRMLTKSDRADKHVGIAQWIESHHDDVWPDRVADLLAHHYGQAAELLTDLRSVGQLSDEVRDRALYWILEVSGRAERLRLLPAVERLCNQGLALIREDQTDTRLTLLLRRARAKVQARDAAGGAEDATMALELATRLGDRSAEAAVLVINGELAQFAGNLDLARTILGEAVELYESAGDHSGRAEALRALGMAELFAGNMGEAERATNEARDAFRGLGRKSGEAWAMQNLAWIAFTQGRILEAESHLVASIEIFADLGDAGGLAWAKGLQGFVRLQEGDFVAAEALQKSVLADARSGGDRWASAMMMMLGSMIRLWTGRTESAAQCGREGMALFKAVHDIFGEVRIAWPLSRALVMLGEIEAGMAVLDELAGDVADGSVEDRATVLLARACAEVHLGRPQEALDAFGEIAQIVDARVTRDRRDTQADRLVAGDGGTGRRDRAGHDEPELLGDTNAWATIALANLQVGNVDGARESIDQVLGGVGVSAADTSVDSSVDNADFTSGVASVLALVCLGEGRLDAIESLAAAVINDTRGTYLDRVYVHIATGLSAARCGNRDATWSAFEEALHAVDATGDVVFQAIVRLAEARALDSLGDAAAVDVTADAWSRLHDLGLDSTGWVAVFDLGLGLTVGSTSR